jgi:hypothetical protein
VRRTVGAISLLLGVIFCCCGNEATDALDAAQKLAAQGKCEEALQKQIWYHNHALQIDPAQYGVRLSFALLYWVQLGKKYPPALKALRQIRDEKTARLIGGELNRSLFDDIVAINQNLDESKATVEAFKKIEVDRPTFASSIAERADQALFDGKEYQLEKKYLCDPFARFTTAKRALDFGLEYAKGHGAASRSGQAFENNFVRDVVRLIVVLDKTGDREIARQIQAKAIAACNRREIEDATSK